MSSQKNVVVVGLGLAGTKAAAQIAAKLPPTHRVVAISAQPFAYWTVASLRAAVVPGWEDKIVRPLTGVLPKNSRHVLLTGVKVVEFKKTSVVLDQDSELGREIEFEYAVIATGSSYPAPGRAPVEARTIEAAKANLKTFQSDLKGASSVLVIGGGPVGIEYAAEVASQYPGKRVTLVSHSSTLAPPTMKATLSPKIQSQLEKLGVRVVLNCKVDTQGLSAGAIEKRSFKIGSDQVEADYIFLAYGNKPNSGIVKAFDASAVDSADLIRVKPTLQLQSYPNIFAIGDICDVLEIKLAYTGGNHAPIVAANIVSLINGQKAAKEYKTGGNVMVVSLGPGAGAGQAFGFLMPSFMVKMAKSKALLVPMFEAEYPL